MQPLFWNRWDHWGCLLHELVYCSLEVGCVLLRRLREPDTICWKIEWWDYGFCVGLFPESRQGSVVYLGWCGVFSSYWPHRWWNLWQFLVVPSPVIFLLVRGIFYMRSCVLVYGSYLVYDVVSWWWCCMFYWLLPCHLPIADQITYACDGISSRAQTHP